MTNKPLRCVFAGTPEFAAQALEALYGINDVAVVGVYTQPDRRAGRGKKIQQSPVKELALSHNSPVFQPLNFKQQEDVKQLEALQADLMIVAAYGILLPQAVLSTPRLGCINIHASLLPRWRGAAPIHRAIEAGDTQTGITIMQMDVGLDTGAMLLKKTLDIETNDTGSSLHDKLATLGASAMQEALADLPNLQQSAQPQENSLACYAHKLNKEDAVIDWQDSAQQIQQKIRAFNSWPVASTTINDKVLRVWQAQLAPACSSDTHVNSAASANTAAAAGQILSANKQGISVQTGEGVLVLTSLQMPGKKALPVKDILNGQAALFQAGQVLGLASNEQANQ